MVSFLQDGFRDSFGLILPAICNHFHVGRAEASFTNSIMVFLTLGSGPLAAYMVKKMGHRLTTIIGVIMSAVDSNLGLANGIAAAGSGFGQFIRGY